LLVEEEICGRAGKVPFELDVEVASSIRRETCNGDE